MVVFLGLEGCHEAAARDRVAMDRRSVTLCCHKRVPQLTTQGEAAFAAQELLSTPEPESGVFGARARSASDAAVLRRKGHLKEQDALIDFLLQVWQPMRSVLRRCSTFCMPSHQHSKRCASRLACRHQKLAERLASCSRTGGSPFLAHHSWGALHPRPCPCGRCAPRTRARRSSRRWTGGSSSTARRAPFARPAPPRRRRGAVRWPRACGVAAGRAGSGALWPAPAVHACGVSARAGGRPPTLPGRRRRPAGAAAVRPARRGARARGQRGGAALGRAIRAARATAGRPARATAGRRARRTRGAAASSAWCPTSAPSSRRWR